VFLSRTLNDSTVIFENPGRDFPQEIGYRRIGSDSLVAWIAGESHGSTRRIDFPYQRVPDAAH
jgi:hypothetical protein